MHAAVNLLPSAPPPAGPAIDLRCRRLTPRHVHDLLTFLARLTASGDGRLFHPHAFTREAVEPLAAFGQGDEYHVLTSGRDGPVIAYGMLRGWKEGYTTPSLGIAVDGQWRGQGIGRRLVTHLQDRGRPWGPHAETEGVPIKHGRARPLPVVRLRVSPLL